MAKNSEWCGMRPAIILKAPYFGYPLCEFKGWVDIAIIEQIIPIRMKTAKLGILNFGFLWKESRNEYFLWNSCRSNQSVIAYSFRISFLDLTHKVKMAIVTMMAKR
jgi:hypothetical protein